MNLVIGHTESARKSIPAELQKRVTRGLHESKRAHTTVRAAGTFYHVFTIAPPQKYGTFMFQRKRLRRKPKKRGTPQRVAHDNHPRISVAFRDNLFYFPHKTPHNPFPLIVEGDKFADGG